LPSLSIDGKVFLLHKVFLLSSSQKKLLDLDTIRRKETTQNRRKERKREGADRRERERGKAGKRDSMRKIG